MAPLVAKKRSLEDGDLEHNLKRRRKQSCEKKSALSFFLHDKVSQADFLSKYWTKDLLHLKLGKGAFGDTLDSCTIESFWKIIKERGESMNFLWTLECNKIVDGKKVKTSPEDGEVKVEDVKKLYDSGSTIQFHHPHHFLPKVGSKLSELEDFFGSNVGSNLYLTPPKCQGLAPHYDTVDVFVCQVEGTKTWRLHRGGKIKPHPIEDSGDLPNDEDEIGPLVREVVMEEGDFLYLPRGTVHYATAMEKGSVHITISTFQDNNYGTLLGRVLSEAVTEAAKHHASLRMNVPVDLLDNFGQYITKEGKEKKRTELTSLIHKQMMPLLEPYLLPALDIVTDEYIIDFMPDRLPPSSMIAERMKEEESEEPIDAPKLVNLKSLEEGTAKIETLVFGPTHLRIVNGELISDEDEDIEFTVLGDAELSDDDDQEQDDDGVVKVDGSKKQDVDETNGSKKQDESEVEGAKAQDTEKEEQQEEDEEEEEEEEEEECYFLVDCGSSNIKTHMVENFRGQTGSSLTKFPKRMKPLVDRLFFSEYRLHEQAELEKLGFDRKDLTPELINFFMRGLIKF